MRSFDYGGDKRNLGRLMAIGCGIGVGVTAVMVVLFAFLMTALSLSAQTAAVFSTLALVIGSLVGSVFTVSKIGSSGLLIGSAVGGILFLLVVLIGLIVSDGGVGLFTVFHFVGSVLAGGIGGLLSVNRAAKKRYRIPK